MPPPASSDHDQRLKVLLKEFFEAFCLCFFPAWAARFEFHDIDWLDKELFLAPPQGEKRQLDLVARLRLRPDAPPPRPGVTDLVALGRKPGRSELAVGRTVTGTAFGSLAFGIASTYLAQVRHVVRNLARFAGPAFQTNRVLQAQLAYSLHHPLVRAVGTSSGEARPHSV